MKRSKIVMYLCSLIANLRNEVKSFKTQQDTLRDEIREYKNRYENVYRQWEEMKREKEAFQKELYERNSF